MDQTCYTHPIGGYSGCGVSQLTAYTMATSGYNVGCSIDLRAVTIVRP